MLKRVNYATTFRGCTDPHFSGISSISQDEIALQVYLHIAMMCPKVHHRTLLMVFLSPMKKSSELVLKRFNISHFSRSHGLPFTRHFVYFSERKDDPMIFAHFHDVPLGASHHVLNGFLTFIMKNISSRA